MQIAYLVNQYPQPSQSFIRREIAALEAQGVRVDRYTLRQSDAVLVDDGDIAEKSKTNAVLGVGAVGLLASTIKTALTRPSAFFCAFRLALKIGRRSERGRITNLIYFAEACMLRDWLAKSGAQHVHAHFGTNSAAVAMLCRVLGGPTYSFTCHGPEEFDKPMAIRLDEKVRHAAFVVAISEFGRSQLYRWSADPDWSKIHVVRCGVDAMFLAAKPHEIPAKPRLVCVGRLSEQKGQLLLIDAIAQLHRDGIDFELMLIGDGPMRPEIERAIERNGLGAKVILGGWMSNARVRHEIQNSRALALPSFAEGLPVVIMESLALHRPVLSTYVAGIPELVEPGVNGWLVPAGSIDALARALRVVLSEDSSRIAAMGAEGAKRVAERHDANREAASLKTLFESHSGKVN